MAILPIFIPHAGCPHQCVFCNQKKISGQSLATVANAKLQIERWLSWLKPGKVNEAAFYGGSFTGLEPQLQEELLALTDELLAKGIIGSVRCSTRPDYIDEERLERLRRHQVTLVELGVQSLDDRVLRAAERGHSAAQVVQAVALLKSKGFKVGLQLMLGMPQQDFASLKETVAQAIALKPDIARIYPLLVVRDTPLAASYLKGEFKPLELEEAVEQAAYVYEALTKNQIKVIRIGLQPDDELCKEGNILAGPFHPSMGELVKSRLLRQQLTPKIEEFYQKGKQSLKILCPAKLQSQVLGLKKANLAYWTNRFPSLKLVMEITNTKEISIIPIN